MIWEIDKHWMTLKFAKVNNFQLFIWTKNIYIYLFSYYMACKWDFNGYWLFVCYWLFLCSSNLENRKSFWLKGQASELLSRTCYFLWTMRVLINASLPLFSAAWWRCYWISTFRSSCFCVCMSGTDTMLFKCLRMCERV